MKILCLFGTRIEWQDLFQSLSAASNAAGSHKTNLLSAKLFREGKKNNIASTRNFNFLFSSINKLGRAAMFEKLCIVSFPESIEHLMN